MLVYRLIRPFINKILNQRGHLRFTLKRIVEKRLPMQFKIYKDVLKKRGAKLATSKPKPASSAPKPAPAKPKPANPDKTKTGVGKKPSAPQNPNEKTGIHNPRARRKKAGGGK